MKIRFALLAAAISAALSAGSFSYADEVYDDNILIPSLGTSGVLGISVQREEAVGEFFSRTARSYLRIADDPVMNDYLKSLGNRLLTHADNVLFNFEFFLVQDSTLNASAFLGGKVAVNTGLFTYADNEDQFASVIAHEIIHVTQRHIARYIEQITQANTLSTAGFIGAVVMSIINPALGAAALTTSAGAAAQAGINYTRDNEYEADRLGIRLLAKAGLNPAGAVELFRKLMAQQGNVNPAFTMLLDHPLSTERLAEAQIRAEQYGRRKDTVSTDYDMARARARVLYETPEYMHKDLTAVLQKNADGFSETYKNYALALNYLKLGEYDKAEEYLNKLKIRRDNSFYIDTATDIDIGRKDYASAVKRLKGLSAKKPLDQTVTANYANTLILSGNTTEAVKLLRNYLLYKNNDVIATDLLYKAYEKSGNQCEAMQIRGDAFALRANYNYALSMYNNALQVCTDSLTQERIKARAAEITTQRARDEELISGN